ILFSIPRSMRILMTCAESSLEIFCFRFPYMVTTPTNIAGLMNKNMMDNSKNDMVSEELNDIKLDMLR
ncbi:7199_t:CDS:1, partial [Funneliformis caledonium]